MCDDYLDHLACRRYFAGSQVMDFIMKAGNTPTSAAPVPYTILSAYRCVRQKLDHYISSNPRSMGYEK